MIQYHQIQNELVIFFKDVPSEQMSIANHLIPRIAFMQITLEDLEEDIRQNGTFELTKTLPRKLRERPVVNTYNALIKNYNGTIKQLLARLPTKNVDEAEDELLAFLRKYDSWNSGYWVKDMELNGFNGLMDIVIQGAKTLSNPLKHFGAYSRIETVAGHREIPDITADKAMDLIDDYSDINTAIKKSLSVSMRPSEKTRQRWWRNSHRKRLR